MHLVLISAAIAYGLSGLLQLRKDLSLPAEQRPVWAVHPALETAVLAGATWFVRIFVDVRRRMGPGRQAVIVTAIALAVHMAIFTAFVWGCIAAAGYLVTGTPWLVGLAALFILTGAPAVSSGVHVLLGALLSPPAGR